MPKFTIETTYRMPHYRHTTYEAPTAEEACRLAIEDDNWSGELRDFECCGPTYVTGIWKGDSSAYEGEYIAVPSHFDEAIQRKADHFPELLDQLAFVAQPMGVSKVDDERWLPKAMAAVAKARAIIDERRDPDEQS
ncbi:hypothetical protein ABGN05_24095 [Aquibium sp. LZ166]|uniref:Uncharacterized protein n=1 Tax=Aquibium pacificus TaxID=3153579 RepID=A0ABV3SR04_9HYPH